MSEELKFPNGTTMKLGAKGEPLQGTGMSKPKYGILYINEVEQALEYPIVIRGNDWVLSLPQKPLPLWKEIILNLIGIKYARFK